MKETGRNEPCPCGSGKKFKRCCGQHANTPAIRSHPTPTSPSIPQTLQAALEHHQAGRLPQAKTLYQQVLQAAPNNPDALHFMGLLAHQMGEIGMAVAYIQKAITLQPGYISAHNNLGNILQEQGKLDEAAACFKKALSFKHDHSELHNNLGNVFHKQGRLDKAIDCFHRALSLNPNFANAHYNLGSVHQELGNLDEATGSFHKALVLKPEYIQAYNNLGNVLREQGRLDEAVACFHKALMLNPDFSTAHFNLGSAFQEQGRLNESMACFHKALNLDPDYHAARCLLTHQLQQICDWKNLEKHSPIMRQAVREAPTTAENLIHPFTFLALPGSTAMEQKRCAEKWVQSTYQPQINFREKLEFDFKRPPNEKFSIGYLSADFRNHPVAQLMAEVFELHDRSRFHIVAYSYGLDDSSPMRKRLEKAFDQFVDIRALSYEAAAKRIHKDKIDILVDLTGYTQHNRSAILALRPAPIQVSYLGYLGTMGADFIDYIIADPFLIPPEDKQHYSENIVYLPSYQANDRQCAVAETPTRTSCGLPAEGIVFCCFNQTYKILPDVFDVWMRLLKAVPGSVFWVYAPNPDTIANLQREAQIRGITPERLIFAETLPLDRHLARLKCADLFLDTLPYNAGTTASNALWAGLPVITCAGGTFSSRMAGSLLIAMGVPELITYNLDDYYTIALSLATDTGKREQIREKIIANRDATPLFDSKRFTRNLEAAYGEMQKNTPIG